MPTRSSARRRLGAIVNRRRLRAAAPPGRRPQTIAASRAPRPAPRHVAADRRRPPARIARGSVSRGSASRRVVDLQPRVADIAQPPLAILLQTRSQQPANQRTASPPEARVQSGSRSGRAPACRTSSRRRTRAAPVSISNSTQPNAQMSAALVRRLAPRLLRAHVGRACRG